MDPISPGLSTVRRCTKQLFIICHHHCTLENKQERVCLVQAKHQSAYQTPNEIRSLLKKRAPLPYEKAVSQVTVAAWPRSIEKRPFRMRVVHTSLENYTIRSRFGMHLCIWPQQNTYFRASNRGPDALKSEPGHSDVRNPTSGCPGSPKVDHETDKSSAGAASRPPNGCPEAHLGCPRAHRHRNSYVGVL